LVSIAAAVLGPALGYNDRQSHEAPGAVRAPPIDAAGRLDCVAPSAFDQGLTAGLAPHTQEAELPPLLDEAERHRVLVEWNRTEADYPLHKCVHELIEAQAVRTPEAIAVVCDDERLTYAQLNARANRLAHRLRSLGVRPDGRVAICAERSLEMVVGLLAILKAGGAYVPLDPGYPAERLAYMLSDSAPIVVLTHGAARAALEEGMAGLADRPPTLVVEEDAAWIGKSAVNPDPTEVGLSSRHLAYVIYTSGSTGQPKGAMNEHRSALNRLLWGQSAFRLGADDRVLQKTPFSFDVSMWEFFWPLLAGARLVMARPGGHRNPAYLVDVIRREGVTTLHFVPSMMQAFLEVVDASGCASLRRVFTSGEALSAGLARLFHERLPGVELHNLYGPTETAVEVTAWTSSSGALPANVPIGRPIANTRIYILDSRREPVPIGAPGEIHIGGMPVGRGYLNRPELTAERFIANPFVKGERLYRTGDVGRFRPDGIVEYLGRNDFQVKIRGFRIELGEIEARLAEHPGVREAAVVAREDAPGDRRLVAFYTARPEAPAPATEKLRAHLAASLPEYMVPAAYVVLESLPLTSSGKLDRNALPAPDSNAFAARGYEPPKGDTEETLARIWAGLLRVERVGRHDNFFELGGHSLLGVRMLSRLRQALGADAPLADLFAKPTLAEFAAVAEEGARSALPAIEPADRGSPLPLSFAQQRLWFLAQIDGVGQAYHIPMNVRLKGELDKRALRQALDRLVARHEALRTTFVAVDGQAVQRIAPADLGFALEEHDLAGERDPEDALQKLVAEESDGAFDLQGGPLARGRLIRLADREHALLFTLHHIVSDGWSTGVLNRELSALYAAFRERQADPLPDLAIQYADYAVWQRRWLSEAMRQEQVDYWRRALAGAAAVLDLPADRPRPPRQDFTGSALPIEFDERVTAGLKALSLRRGTTLFMTVLAGWAALLSRLSGHEDLVIGAAVANRGRVEIEPLIGFFVNSLALRLDLSGDPSVAELLDRIKQRVLEAQQHEDLPFEQVVEIVRPPRSLAHEPIFQTMFAWQNHEEEPLELPGLTTTLLGAPRSHAKYDLTLSLGEAGGRIVGDLEYATALLDRQTIERHAGYLNRLLEAMATDEKRTIDRLPLLGEAERHRLIVAWNKTERDYPRDACVHELFEAQAVRTPEAIALAHNDARLTYGELGARANRLARHLRILGVRRNDRVAIALERSIGLVVAQLAILKCGAAYVPLDQTAPLERQVFMIEDCEARVLLTALGAIAPEMAGVTRVDVDNNTLSGPDARDWDPSVDAQAIAYVMYTSGSTGRPKGVMAPHRAIARLALNNGFAEFLPTDRVAFASNPAFDASTMEVWATLLNGGAIVVIDQPTLLDPQRFKRQLENHAVSVLWLTAGLFHQYADALADPFARLRYLITGGDVVDPRVVARVLEASPPQRLLNGYGPTETTTFAATHPIRDVASTAAIPIGRPISNARIYILDRHREPVPIGAAGEIYIGGDGVARGYLNRPELTAERFIASPFVDGDRLYRTGDLGRFGPDGTIEFLGRNDFQVKIRGFRIELGEIEARLGEHPSVREAVVLAREHAVGERRLAAYYTARPDEAAPGAEALRTHLAASLPEYMVPAAYVRLEALPLTANGKLDRNALPAPDSDAFALRGYEPPRGETEAALAPIWAEALKLDRVGRHDNFFDLGGHSLLAIRLLSRINASFKTDLPLSTVFHTPTIATLAELLENQTAPSEWYSMVPIRRQGSRPPLFCMEVLGAEFFRLIGAEQPIYSLRFGVGSPRGSVLLLPRIEDLAVHYIQELQIVQPKGPYFLVGYSWGGLVAYETAQQLTAKGEVVEFVALVDTVLPTTIGHTLGDRFMRLISSRRMLEKIKYKIRTKLTVQGLKYYSKLRFRRLMHGSNYYRPDAFDVETIYKIIRSYHPRPYSGRVIFFKATESSFLDGRRDQSPEEGWERLAGPGLEFEEVSCDHAAIMKGPNVARIVRRIRAAMDSATIRDRFADKESRERLGHRDGADSRHLG
jgi:amino acid adenylation domain-containing protein